MKTQSYHTFWQRIHMSAKDSGLPLRVMFELTYRCNFSCRHCYVPLRFRKYKELSTKNVFSILRQLRDSGCFYLGFTGGEPFARNDIMQILWYAKKLGFQIIIYTNGSLIQKKQVMELARLGPNKIDITIPAMSQAAFERISGLRGSRDKVFRTITLLHNNRVKLGFKTCALKENENEIDQIRDFTASLGALHRLDGKLMPCLDGSKEPYKYRRKLGNDLAASHQPPVTLLKEAAEQCNSKLNHHKPSIKHQASRIKNLFKCGVGETQAAITPLGELKMCLMIDYPNYKIHRDLKADWQRLKKLVVSIKPDENNKCPHCSLRDYCKWCPANAWLQNKSFTSCDLDSQLWAEQTKDRNKAFILK